MSARFKINMCCRDVPGKQDTVPTLSGGLEDCYRIAKLSPRPSDGWTAISSISIPPTKHFEMWVNEDTFMHHTMDFVIVVIEPINLIYLLY